MPDKPTTSTHPSLILASSSQRRRELLRQIGIDPLCLAADIDEAPLPDEAAERLVQRLAIGKARAVAHVNTTALPILGADTVVCLDGDVLGKPAGKDEAIEMLLRLQDREHRVMTGVCLLSGSDCKGCERRESVILVRSIVRFAPVSLQQAERYWRTGEPAGKAGAYAIQGYAARFVAHLSGSYSNVVGLPIFETARLLDTLGD